MDNPLENNVSAGSDSQVSSSEVTESLQSEMPVVTNSVSKKSFFTIRKIVSIFAGLVVIGAVIGTVLYSQSGERLQGSLITTHQVAPTLITSTKVNDAAVRDDVVLARITPTTTDSAADIPSSTLCDSTKGLIVDSSSISLATHVADTATCICEGDLGWDSSQNTCVAASCDLTDAQVQKILSDSKTSDGFETAYKTFIKYNSCDEDISVDLIRTDLATTTSSQEIKDKPILNTFNPATLNVNPDLEINERAPDLGCPDGMILEGTQCVCGEELNLSLATHVGTIATIPTWTGFDGEVCVDIAVNCDLVDTDREVKILLERWEVIKDSEFTSTKTKEYLKVLIEEVRNGSWYEENCDTCEPLIKDFIEQWTDEVSILKSRTETAKDLMDSDCDTCEIFIAVFQKALINEDLPRVIEIVELMQGDGSRANPGCEYCEIMNYYMSLEPDTSAAALTTHVAAPIISTFKEDLKNEFEECFEDDVPTDTSHIEEEIPTDTTHVEEEIPTKSCTLIIVEPVDAKDGQVTLASGYSNETLKVDVISDGYDITEYKYHSMGGTIKFDGQDTEYFTANDSAEMNHIVNADDEIVVWAVDSDGKGRCNDSFKVTMLPEEEEYIPRDPCVEILDKLEQIDAGTSDLNRVYWLDQYEKEECTDYFPPPVRDDDDDDDGCPECPTCSTVTCPELPTCPTCPTCSSTTTSTTSTAPDPNNYISTSVPSNTTSTTSVGSLHGAAESTSLPGEPVPTSAPAPLHPGAPMPTENPETGPGLLLLFGAAGLGGAYVRRKRK